MKFKDGQPYPIDEESDAFGQAIRDGEFAYREAFPTDRFGWGMTWVKVAEEFKDVLTVDNLREAKEWGKDKGWCWAVGTFRRWLMEQDEKVHVKQLQEDAVQASQQPLVKEIAKTCVAKDEYKDAKEYWEGLTGKEKRESMDYYKRRTGFDPPENMVIRWHYKAVMGTGEAHFKPKGRKP